MRLALWYVGVLLVLWFGMALCSESAHASTGGWADSGVSITKLGRGIELSDTSAPCNGLEATIEVEGYADRFVACIFGTVNSVRVARYVDQGIFLYAIAFPSDDIYSKIEGLCPGILECSYASNTDVFAVHRPLPDGTWGVVLYRHFSRLVVSHRSALGVTYVFVPQQKGDELTTDNSVVSSAFSGNGEWFIVKTNQLLLRVNINTLERHTTTLLDDQLSSDPNPQYELAISNDGRFVGIGGFGLGLDIIEIERECNVPGVSGVPLCNIVHITPYEAFPGFTAARRLHFSSDGMSIFAMVLDTNGMTRIVIRPKGAVVAPIVDYVAIGDSFTSGEGETSDSYYEPATNSASNRCHVSTRSYPYLVGRSWQVSTRNIACSGAKISDVVSTTINNTQFVQMETLRPKIVSVGLGGNDAGLMDKLKSCVWVTTCEWAKNLKLRASVWREIYSVGKKLQELVDRIRVELPDTRIILMSYPRLIAGYEIAHCDAVTGLLLDGVERRFMDEAVQHLNMVIRSVSNVAFGDIEGAFMGEELCNGKSLAMNGVRLGGDIAPISQLPIIRVVASESFHPTPYGHAHIARRLLSLFSTPDSVARCLYCGSLDGAPSQYWQTGDDTSDQPQFVADTFAEEPLYETGDKVTIKTKPYFSPSALLKIELHSDTRVLLDTVANEDGKLYADVPLPQDIEFGYHTLHIVGEARSGRVLDIYQTIWIGQQGVPLRSQDISAGVVGKGGESDLRVQDVPRKNVLTAKHSTNLTYSVIDDRGEVRPSKKWDSFWFVVIIFIAIGCVGLVVLGIVFYRKRHGRV